MDREQSEFNNAVNYLNRINALFYQADEASMNADARGWHSALCVLFRELSTELTDKEISLHIDLRKKILVELSMFDRDKSRTGKPVISEDLYELLDTWERLLRKVSKESGLQQKVKESPEFALGGG